MNAQILVVDDDERSRKLATDLLRHHGHAVVAVRDGESAAAHLARHRADLLLLDLQLPGISGLELLGWMKSQPGLTAIPVVAMTASVMPSQYGELSQCGFAAFLPKPLSIRMLVEVVNDCLEGASR